MRAMYGFLAAPALFPLAYLAWAIGHGDNTQVVMTLDTTLPVAYVLAIGLGLPAYLLLRAMRESSIAGYVVLGLVLAVIAQVAYLDSLISNWRLWWAGVTGQIALGPIHTLGGQTEWWIAGAGTGALFWLIVRPDRRGKNVGFKSNRVVIDGPHRSGP